MDLKEDLLMQILIADDDITSRRILAAVLAKSGYEVVETANGSQAWAVMQRSDSPRLVILDWMMPEMDGLEVLRLVRTQKRDKSPYILLLTSRDEKADIISGLAAGADDYLSKPFDPGELKARVDVGRRMVEMQDALTQKIEELSWALAEIKTLHGIIPICTCCKKIRDDQGFWTQVEIYVRNHSEAEFSHSLCPGCMKKLYPEYPGIDPGSANNEG
jgi:PleD family two-component response regulator